MQDALITLTGNVGTDVEFTQGDGWSLARFEFWLSASGWLRAWLRLNLFLSVLLMIAGISVSPASRVARNLRSPRMSS